MATRQAQARGHTRSAPHRHPQQARSPGDLQRMLRAAGDSVQGPSLGLIALLSLRHPARLTQAPHAGRHSPLGPFEQKCVVLAILETDAESRAVTPLGRVVIDLAEYAALDGQESKAFAVVCSKAVAAAVGVPQLAITVRWVPARSHFGVGACNCSEEGPRNHIDVGACDRSH
jgi:hypothetical protein